MTTYKEEDIVLEDGDYFAIRVPKGYEVYVCGGTHATRCGIIGKYPLEKALDIAWGMIDGHKERTA